MSVLELLIRVPRDGEPRPSRLVTVPAIDTGGAWRAVHRPQDPAQDPAEPGGGESSSAGTDHGWSNCTMSAGAVAYAYEAHYAGRDDSPWGGHLRHSGQPDMSGGTDLGDLRDAWARRGGYNLEIRSGDGWEAVVEAHGELRAVVVQGEGDVPGSGDFTGSHACCIGPETASDGRWLWSDPVTSGWQWASPSSIRSWAERLDSGVSFAVSRPAPAGGGMAIPVVSVAPELADVSEGVQLYRPGTVEPALKMPQTRTGIRVPLVTRSPSGTAMPCVIYTRPDPDPDELLAVYNADARNRRPDPAYAGGDAGDPDAIRADRDEEWREWLLAGAPGEE